MKNYILASVASFVVSACASDVSIDLKGLAHSVVDINYYFDETERSSFTDGCIGFAATAWFFRSDRCLVTAGHVIDGMPFSKTNWTKVDICQQAYGSEDRRTNHSRVRIIESVKTRAENIIVLELKEPFIGARVLDIRREPMTNGSPIVSLAYPHGHICFARGIFHGIAPKNYQDVRIINFALLEMYSDSDRLILDHGSSGAPILDDDGRVVAILGGMMRYANEIILPFDLVTRVIKSWETPNYFGTMTDALQKFTVSDDVK